VVLWVVRRRDVYGALVALGPGTESVSSNSLSLWSRPSDRAFVVAQSTTRTLTCNAKRLKAAHARDLLEAVRTLEGTSSRSREEWIRSAIESHRSFWDGVKSALRSASGSGSRNPPHRVLDCV